MRAPQKKCMVLCMEMATKKTTGVNTNVVDMFPVFFLSDYFRTSYRTGRPGVGIGVGVRVKARVRVVF